MLLIPEIITTFIIDGIFLILGFIAFYISIQIVLKWDFSSTSPLQYKLIKKSYLSSTIIKYILFFKILMFIFFIYTIDKLSNVITGAMCGAGVINASMYGIYLIILKLINIYLFGFWLVLNKNDISNPLSPYTKLKSFFYIFIYLLLVMEISLEFAYFLNLNPGVVVSCCGSIYSATSSSYISSFIALDTKIVQALFFGLYFFLVVFYIYKLKYLYSIFSAIFLVVSILSIIAYFGTYIYELPTHHCPFCLLQKDYNYIGYLIYLLLYVATFYGMVLGFLTDYKKELNLSFIFLTFFVLVLIFYPIRYFLINGVWL
jgi:hypothetical protein